jgi:hypothetical protein
VNRLGDQAVEGDEYSLLIMDLSLTMEINDIKKVQKDNDL